MISKELQLGKAGEHLVCYDLILHGHNAFLADQGLPYDVLVDINGKLKKIQVKSTTKLIDTKTRAKRVYRFGLRKGNINNFSRLIKIEVDYIACVALDIKTIAYIPINIMTRKDGNIKTCIEFKTRKIDYGGRYYKNGSRRNPDYNAKFIEDFPNL